VVAKTRDMHSCENLAERAVLPARLMIVGHISRTWGTCMRCDTLGGFDRGQGSIFREVG
jgi:hypothetical protein